MSLSFADELRQGIPAELPPASIPDPSINHAPKRKDILTQEEKKLAIRNALRYFDPKHHSILSKEFAEELKHTDGSTCIVSVQRMPCMHAL